LLGVVFVFGINGCFTSNRVNLRPVSVGLSDGVVDLGVDALLPTGASGFTGLRRAKRTKN
jgi:hypothetical protein